MKLTSVAFLVFFAAISSSCTNPVETFLEVPGPSGPLRGTMLTPAHCGGPVAIIIPGSGPVDRDGNSPVGLKASTYRFLANGLAEHGIITIRIDKRGMFGSAAAVPDANAATISDYANDVHLWLATIRRRTGASCVWLLGHSEGALVALVAAQQASGICGLGLISAAGRPIGEVLREQLISNPSNAPLLGQALPAIDALETGNHIDTAAMSPALLPIFRPQVQNFLIDELSYDPVALLAKTTMPVLILQGKRDLQIGEKDALLLKGAKNGIELSLLSNTNHVLKSVSSEERGPNIATYSDPSLPLAPGVIEVIVKFIAATQNGR